MALQRAAFDVTSYPQLLRHFASATARSCRCHISSANTRNALGNASRRNLSTEHAYRPHQLPESLRAPPRNAGVPKTSITSPNISQSPELPRSRLNGSDKESPTDDVVTASLAYPQPESSESIGQPRSSSSRPTNPATTAQREPNSEPQVDRPSQQERKDVKPRRKLRPRKAALSITPPALQHLQRLATQPESKMIRVGVRNRGCSGLAYHLEYVDKPASFDEVVEQEGVKVLIDSKALFSIIGSEMDWQEDALQSRFIFRNPNIKEQCGCGESFMV